MMQKSIAQCKSGYFRASPAFRANQFRKIAFKSAPKPRNGSLVMAAHAEIWAPPTVADTKKTFQESFDKPLPTIYSTVVLELLVQQHLFRWNKAYQYSEVTALGICSIFDQILEGLPEGERNQVFNAYVKALKEDPEKYRSDAARLESWARSLSNPSDVMPNADGSEGQQALAKVAEANESSNFLYTKFFAVGLFRMLELAGGKDPKALSALVTSLGISQERVTADLTMYKGVLSKLQAAKEIMQEFINREKKKAAERAAAKAATDSDGSPPQPVEA